MAPKLPKIGILYPYHWMVFRGSQCALFDKMDIHNILALYEQYNPLPDESLVTYLHIFRGIILTVAGHFLPVTLALSVGNEWMNE